MLRRSFITTSIIIILLPANCGQAVEGEKSDKDLTEAGFLQLFNGRDLTGWNGDPNFWSVKDGIIVAQVKPGITVKNHSYLIWQGGNVRDFELRLKMRSTVGNSGIDYRAAYVLADRDDQPLKWTIQGYQSDIAEGWMGSLYNWGKPGAQPGQFVVVSDDENITKDICSVVDKDVLYKSGYYRPKHWNEYTVIARGSHILQTINGFPVVEFIDNSRDKRRQGLLGLQVHSGKRPFLNEFKDIRIRKFKDNFGQARLLFNGRDFTGWIFPSDEAKGAWKVEEGMLVNRGRNYEHPTPYISTKDVYNNYVLRFQYRKQGGQETAVLLRFVDSPQSHPKGIRVYGKGNDFNCIQCIGDLTSPMIDRSVPLAFKPMPHGFWNECEIKQNNNQLEVRVNNVLRAIVTGCNQPPGKIAFQASQSSAEYRNIVLIPIISSVNKKAIPQTGKILSAQELLENIIASERKIRDVQLHMTCTIPEKRYTFYEYDWGYEGGKELFNGLTHYSKDGKYSHTLKEFTAFDGNKQRVLRYQSDGITARGAVRALRPQTFRTMITPNTLLGFDAKEISRQSFGEAMAGAESVHVREEIEEIDGHPCLVIEAFMVETDPVVKTLSYDVRAWIDTKRDFRLLKFEKCRSITGKNRWKVLSRRVENIKLKLINGTWFPVEGDRTTFTIKDETPPEGMTGEEFSKLSMEEQRQIAVYEIEKLLPAQRLRIDVNSIKINEGIPPEKFNIKFPPGCVVWDDFAKKGYTVKKK